MNLGDSIRYRHDGRGGYLGNSSKSPSVGDPIVHDGKTGALNGSPGVNYPIRYARALAGGFVGQLGATYRWDGWAGWYIQGDFYIMDDPWGGGRSHISPLFQMPTGQMDDLGFYWLPGGIYSWFPNTDPLYPGISVGVIYTVNKELSLGCRSVIVLYRVINGPLKKLSISFRFGSPGLTNTWTLGILGGAVLWTGNPYEHPDTYLDLNFDFGEGIVVSFIYLRTDNPIGGVTSADVLYLKSFICE